MSRVDTNHRADAQKDVHAHAATAPTPSANHADNDEEAASLAPGERIGQDYTIVELIEIGGIGEIYRARHEAMGRDVAIKVIRPRFRTNDELVSRQQREARALALVNDPGVVKVLHAGTDERVGFYIVMELLVGKSLRAIMDWMPVMPPRDALGILIEAADTTDVLHTHGIFHRDLKPENLFVCKVRDENRRARIRVKILDLGAAKNINPKRSGPKHPSTLLPIVTPAYMSPEQANHHEVTTASDQYSLAIIGYEMLAGRHIYGAHHPGAPGFGMWVMWHTMGDREPLHKVNPRLPSYLWPVFERALSKDPSDRYPSTWELAQALRTLFARCLAEEAEAGVRSEAGGWMTTALESSSVKVRTSRTDVMTYPQRGSLLQGGPLPPLPAGPTQPTQPTLPSPSRSAASEAATSGATSQPAATDPLRGGAHPPEAAAIAPVADPAAQATPHAAAEQHPPERTRLVVLETAANNVSAGDVLAPFIDADSGNAPACHVAFSMDSRVPYHVPIDDPTLGRGFFLFHSSEGFRVSAGAKHDGSEHTIAQRLLVDGVPAPKDLVPVENGTEIQIGLTRLRFDVHDVPAAPTLRKETLRRYLDAGDTEPRHVEFEVLNAVDHTVQGVAVAGLTLSIEPSPWGFLGFDAPHDQLFFVGPSSRGGSSSASVRVAAMDRRTPIRFGEAPHVREVLHATLEPGQRFHIGSLELRYLGAEANTAAPLSANTMPSAGALPSAGPVPSVGALPALDASLDAAPAHSSRAAAASTEPDSIPPVAEPTLPWQNAGPTFPLDAWPARAHASSPLEQPTAPAPTSSAAPTPRGMLVAATVAIALALALALVWRALKPSDHELDKTSTDLPAATSTAGPTANPVAPPASPAATPSD